MLTIKFVMFLALELFVASLVGSILLGGLYAIVRDAVRDARLQDGVRSQRVA